MRYGFEPTIAINTGTPTAPVWAPLDVAADLSIDDDSDEVDVATRRGGGRKDTGRSLLSRGISFAINAPSAPASGSPPARLLAASRGRDSTVDVCAFDDATLDAEGLVATGTGVRFAALVKLTDAQPLGDRRLVEVELKPGRRPASWVAAGLPAIDAAYEFTGTPLEPVEILTEGGVDLLTEFGEPLLTEG